LAWSFSLLEPISLLLLASSFYCGLRRLHYSSESTRINHDLNDAEEKSMQMAGSLETWKLKPTFTSKNEQEAIETIQFLRKRVGDYEPLLDAANAATKVLYNRRDKFLIAGFAAIFFAKLLQPYEIDYVPAGNAIYKIMNVTPPPPRPQTDQNSTLHQPAGAAKSQAALPTISSPSQSTNSMSQSAATSGQTNPQPPATNPPSKRTN
jgi:hypothetical protein